MAIVLAAKRWSHLRKNKHVVIQSDNTTAVSIINKDTCKNSTVTCHLRELFRLSAIFYFRITAVYIPDHMNCIADAISRLHEPYFLLKAYGYLVPHYGLLLLHWPLLMHMSVVSCSFLFFRYFGLCFVHKFAV